MRLILPTPELSLTPGEPAPVDLVVWNDGDTHEQFRVRAVGVEDAWNAPPQETPVLAPDERHTVRFVVTLPEGFPAGEHACAFEALRLDPAADNSRSTTGSATGDPSVADRVEIALHVDDLSKVTIQLEPRRVQTNGKFAVRVQNRSLEPLSVDLRGRTAGDRSAVSFKQSTVDVRPGGEGLVKGRIKGERHLFGEPRKTTFTVVAQGRSAPLAVSGTWERRAMLRSNVLKVMAVLTVLAIWGVSVGNGLTWLRDRYRPERVTLQDPAFTDALAESADGAEGSDGDATADDGAESAAPDGDPTAVDSTVPGVGRVVTSVGGVIEGPAGDGVRVQLRPVSRSVVASSSGGGGGVGGAAAASGVVGKSLGHLADVFVQIGQMQESASTSDGVWSFGGVEGPGFYEVRFGKVGFQTKSALVEIDEEGTPVSLDVVLDQAFGRVVGTAVDADGAPVAGATIAVTDGLVRAETTADGNGDFTVDGLTQDARYTVSAAAPGFGTGFAGVRLEGEQSPPVIITLQRDVGTIFGTVLSTRDDVLADNGGTLGLADARVTVTDGADLTRTISTLDDGFFSLEGLPFGGPYTVTFEADGHLTQTQSVLLPDSELELGVTLLGDSGRVQGTVVDDAAGDALNGVGVTLQSEGASFKTLTDAAGAFDIVDVPPGDYTITFGLFGFTEQLSNVTVAAGSVTTVPTIRMPIDTTEAFPATGSIEITAFIADEPDTKLPELSVFVNEELRGVTDDSGFLRIEGIAAGTSFIRITDLRTRPAVAEFTRPVNIGEGGSVDLQAGMRRLASLKGKVTGPDITTIDGVPDIVNLPGIAICLLPADLGARYLDPIAGSCREDGALLDSTSTAIDGSYGFDVIPSGTYDVVYQSVLLPNPPVAHTDVDQVAFLYQATVNQLTFSAGTIREEEDIVLNLFPILDIEVVRPVEGTGPGGSDDLTSFVPVEGATLEFYNSGALRFATEDPRTARQDDFVVRGIEGETDVDGKISVQVLSPDPDITVYALSPDSEIGRPIDVPGRPSSGSRLDLSADPNSVRNVVIPLVTNRSVTGSFEVDYPRFALDAQSFTTDDPSAAPDVLALPPGELDVRITGTFDVVGDSALAPNPASPDVGPDRTVTRISDDEGNWVFTVDDDVDVPAGATVTVSAGGTGTPFAETSITDVAIPQTADLTGQKLTPAQGDRSVEGIVRHLCSNASRTAPNKPCPLGDRVVTGREKTPSGVLLSGSYQERNPGAGIEVSLVSAADPNNPRTVATDADGAFRFDDVPLGQHRIVLHDPARIWEPAANGEQPTKADHRIARVLVDVLPDRVVYRNDTPILQHDPQLASSTATDPSEQPAENGSGEEIAYIGMIEGATVDVTLENVSGTPTTVQLYRVISTGATVEPCGEWANTTWSTLEREVVVSDGTVSFTGLLSLEIPISYYTGSFNEPREYFCVRAFRPVSGSTADDEDVVPVPDEIPGRPSQGNVRDAYYYALRDGTISLGVSGEGTYEERPLTTAVSLSLNELVRFTGAVESARGSYTPVSGGSSVDIVDILSTATVDVRNNLGGPCGTNLRTSTVSDGDDGADPPVADGSFLTGALVSANDHCVRVVATGHDTRDFPRPRVVGTDDLGTVQLTAKRPDLTVNLVDTFGDPVEIGATGSVTLRFTPDGLARADAAIGPDLPDPADPEATAVTFEDVVPTIYEIVIAVPGYATVTKTVNVLPTDAADVTLATTSVLVQDLDPNENIELEGEASQIVGSVKVGYGGGSPPLLGDLSPGRDFTLTVTRNNKDLSDRFTLDQNQDTFRGDLSPGTYTFTATATDYNDGTATVTVKAGTPPPGPTLVLTPLPRNVVVPLAGIDKSALEEMNDTVLGLTPHPTNTPGTAGVNPATVVARADAVSAATFTNVVPGTYRLTIDVPNSAPNTRLSGYRDITTAEDATAFPPQGGEETLTIHVPANSVDDYSAPLVRMAVYKRIDLFSGEGPAGRAIKKSEALATGGQTVLEPQGADADAAAYFVFTSTTSDSNQDRRSLTFNASGHDSVTITIVADGTTPATQTVCLAKSEIPGNNGPDGDAGTADDVATIPADDCTGIPGVLTG